MINSEEKSNNNKKRMENRLPKEGEQWQTRILPPPLQNNVKLKQIKIPDKKDISNPSIHEVLNLKIKSNDISHARTLLRYFENSGIVTWNSHGDLYSPLNNYNIIDIIYDFIYKNPIYDNKKIEDYRYLISATNIPSWLIKNNTLMNKIKTESITLPAGTPTLLSSTRLKKKKGSGSKSLIMKHKRSNNTSKWICY